MLAAASRRFLLRPRAVACLSAGPQPGGGDWIAPGAAPPGQALQKYGRDLTELARSGKLDPVIGRGDEIRRATEILARRTKSSSLLLGDAGVGKTSIAEGLALRIAEGEVPESIRDKSVVALDIPGMVAGASYRGEFEDRVKAVLKDVEEAHGKVILFIDEMHLLVGAGASEGGMDASNMLKPALARGELQCMGATTLDEYRKYIEKDPALARRFQTVLVQEPSVEDTVSILRGLKEHYEVHHGVRISDGAIVAAAKLSDRYIQDRYMPDKAIDLVDESASRLRLQQESKPEAIERLDRRLVTAKIELEALRKEKDADAVARRERLQTRVAELEQERGALASVWEAERDRLNAIKDAKEQLEAARRELQLKQRGGDLARAGELRFSVIPELEARVAASAEEEESSTMLSDEVTAEHIAEVVSRATGVPVSKMLDGERAKLAHMEDVLRGRVVGQDAALAAISDGVRMSRAGLKPHDRPISVSMFLGPTGVGKTELCKALAEFMFDDEGALIRIDMSEYMEKHSVARLIGAPPGYVGYEEGGQLTEAVRRRPYSVVLFDEMEKAHRDVANLLLQVFDDGRLTDSQGRTVDFRNTVIIMTSNLGAPHIADLPEDASVAEAEPAVLDAVRAHFPPEFINRVDDLLVFERLAREQIHGILDIKLAEVQALLDERKQLLTLAPEAREWLANRGFEPRYGARPLQRAVQTHLLKPLARGILADENGLATAGEVYVTLGAGGPDGEALEFVGRAAPAPVDAAGDESDSDHSDGEVGWASR